ncbi:MAG: dicarboxylate/amino acid:cation symporter [Sulfurimonadaceae bacterium]|nr:dicarboxylate/amino acid:cation symporter [Sulfurimonadaceae bacterium]
MTHFFKKYLTTNTLVLLAIVLGICFGVFLPEIALSQQILGQIFISLLQMLVVPLVFASIYVAILNLGSLNHLRAIGSKTIGMYLLTMSLATTLAIIAMNILSVGEPLNSFNPDGEAIEITPFSLHAMILSFIPSNIFRAMSEGSMIQVIVFAALFGIASLHLGEKEQTSVKNLFNAIAEAMLKMASWIIKLTPIGVFSLISYVVAEQGLETILGLWSYVLIVVGAILFHGLLTLPLVFWLLTKKNPYIYLVKVREATIMAFSTASSSATLPVSLRVAEEKGGVEKKITAFVLPLGASISMDGTAMYLSIAVLYIANLAGVSLTFYEQILLGITVVSLSVGVAALPSASIVMMVVILEQLSLPVEYIALILAVDRILDMCRTALNVTSDLVVAKIIDSLEKKALDVVSDIEVATIIDSFENKSA